MRKRRLWLCVTPWVLCALDNTLTLWWQDPRYWRGFRGLASEANPIGLPLLRMHPLAYEAGVLAWVAVFTAAIVCLPRRVAMAVSIAVVLGHTSAVILWFYRMVESWYGVKIGLVIAVAILAEWTRRMFEASEARERTSSLEG